MAVNIAEDALEDLTLTNTSVTTTGKTLNVYVSSVGGGSGTLIGTAGGAAAGTDITITCDFAGIIPGDYVLEVIADVGAANPITIVPNDVVGWPFNITIKEIENTP